MNTSTVILCDTAVVRALHEKHIDTVSEGFVVLIKLCAYATGNQCQYRVIVGTDVDGRNSSGCCALTL